MPLEAKSLGGWLLPAVTDIGRGMGERLDPVRIHCEAIEVWNLKRKSNVV